VKGGEEMRLQREMLAVGAFAERAGLMVSAEGCAMLWRR
jgi:hypothetical protein